jgi:diadenosine tetraphosphate (Ap4A) HIT family hydrolase
MSETVVQEISPSESGYCHVCDLRSNAPSESIIYVDDRWTVAVGFDVPGWFMVILNRHSEDWFMGLSDREATTLGPLVRSLGNAAVADAGAERVYLMGFGEQWSHFHFAVMSRTATVSPELRGAGLLAHAPELANRDEAVRLGSKVRERLTNATVPETGATA